MKRFLTAILSFLIVILIFVGTFQYFSNIEMYSSTARYHLILDVDKHVPEAIALYDNYCERGIFLGDTEHCIAGYARTHNRTYSDVFAEFYNSDYSTFQEYYDRELND